MDLKILAVLGLTLPLLGACGGTNCMIAPDDNLVRIVSAQYADGTPIPEVQLSGVPAGGGATAAHRRQGVRYENGGQLWCTVGCAVGRPGRYTVTVSAPGAVPQQIEVNIASQYVKEGFAGCGYNRETGIPQEVRLVFERE